MTSTNQAEDRLAARVAFIISDREVLLDKGIDDGVELGMRFAILGSKEVQNSAGLAFKLSYPKGTVKVVRFENDGKNAVGRTFKTIKGRPALGSLASLVSTYSAATPDRVAKIRTESADTFKDRLTADDYNVFEGDPAHETRGDEYDD